MSNIYQTVERLDAHAESARKIGSTAEAEAFEAKARELREKHSIRKPWREPPDSVLRSARLYGDDSRMKLFNQYVCYSDEDLAREESELRRQYQGLLDKMVAIKDEIDAREAAKKKASKKAKKGAGK